MKSGRRECLSTQSFIVLDAPRNFGSAPSPVALFRHARSELDEEVERRLAQSRELPSVRFRQIYTAFDYRLHLPTAAKDCILSVLSLYTILTYIYPAPFRPFLTCTSLERLVLEKPTCCSS